MFQDKTIDFYFIIENLFIKNKLNKSTIKLKILFNLSKYHKNNVLKMQ